MALTLNEPATRAHTVHGQDTLPRLFRHVVAARGDAVAMREKLLGIWQPITWRQYGERVRHVGLGLVALGLRPRDVVSVIADNCPEWLYADLGTPEKVLVDLGCASHNAMWEKGAHTLLFNASLEWLEKGTVNGAQSGIIKMGY